MEQQLFYRVTDLRRNPIKDAIFAFFIWISGYPMLTMEVFLREQMGERYYSTFGSIVIVLFLIAVPYYYGSLSGQSPWLPFATWYIFTAAFAYFSFKRWKEISHDPSTFNFDKYTLSTGYSLEFLEKFAVFRNRFNPRILEVYIEPAVFFVSGIILFCLGQLLGILFIFCSICYSLCYAARYKISADFLKDQNDRRIANEQLYSTFVEEKPPRETGGFQARFEASDDKMAKAKLTEDMLKAAAASVK